MWIDEELLIWYFKVHKLFEIIYKILYVFTFSERIHNFLIGSQRDFCAHNANNAWLEYKSLEKTLLIKTKIGIL